MVLVQKKGSEPVTCNTCKGNGQVRFSQGFFSVQQTCPECNGSGKVIKNPCPDCKGHGVVKETCNESHNHRSQDKDDKEE
jgi:molecular chaperone DnaJ